MTMQRRAATVAITAMAGLASAQSAQFVVFENSDGVDVSGLSIGLEVTDLGTQVEFLISNNSEIESRVTSIYFESTEFTRENLSDPLIQNFNGVHYTSDRVAPRSPAGSIRHTEGGDWRGTLFGLEPTVPQPNITAMSPGEKVSVIFDLGEGLSASDVFSALNDPVEGFRISMHIQSVGPNGSSVWAVIPTPGTVTLFGLGGLLACRRRRSAA
ncbi:MAG: hypothetical protein ACF8Q5_06920 [Phycisphaerales bacterium JB040]